MQETPPEDASDGPDTTDGGDEDEGTATDGTRETAGDVTATYDERGGERLLTFEREGRTATIAQNLEGYAMLKVRPSPEGDELERYYGFDMALDHAAELLGVDPSGLPVPAAAADMGM